MHFCRPPVIQPVGYFSAWLRVQGPSMVPPGRHTGRPLRDGSEKTEKPNSRVGTGLCAGPLAFGCMTRRWCPGTARYRPSPMKIQVPETFPYASLPYKKPTRRTPAGGKYVAMHCLFPAGCAENRVLRDGRAGAAAADAVSAADAVPAVSGSFSPQALQNRLPSGRGAPHLGQNIVISSS